MYLLYPVAIGPQKEPRVGPTAILVACFRNFFLPCSRCLERQLGHVLSDKLHCARTQVQIPIESSQSLFLIKLAWLLGLICGSCSPRLLSSALEATGGVRRRGGRGRCTRQRGPRWRIHADGTWWERVQCVSVCERAGATSERAGPVQCHARARVRVHARGTCGAGFAVPARARPGGPLPLHARPCRGMQMNAAESSSPRWGPRQHRTDPLADRRCSHGRRCRGPSRVDGGPLPPPRNLVPRGRCVARRSLL